MYVNEGLREARLTDVQQVIPFISIGVGIDTTAADDIDTWTYSGLPMSNPAQITNANYFPDTRMAVYEGDGIPSALANNIVAPPLNPKPAPPEVGIWSDSISGADGSINWSFEVKLKKAHTSALTVYTGGQVNIITAQVTYYKGSQAVRQATLTGKADSVQDREITTYDRVRFNVLKITEAYHHVRISEVEFGASITISNAKLTDVITLITEGDPLGLAVPLYELDFNLLNVDGEFDIDNPSQAVERYKIGTPVYFSLTIITSHGQITAPMGRFYVVSRDARPDALEIAAQDIRAILQNTVRPMTLRPSVSVGETLQAMFTDNDVPFIIDDAVYNVYPPREHRFNDKLDLLKQLLYIQQFFDIYTIPQRDGYIHVVKGMPAKEGDPITAEILIEYPRPSIAQGYNVISINYGDNGHYDLDLRTEADAAILPLNVDNPLIMTEAEARTIADRIRARFYTQEYEAEAYGDPGLDIFDNVSIEGRFTRGGNAERYQIIRTELEYSGALTMRVKGVR